MPARRSTTKVPVAAAEPRPAAPRGRSASGVATRKSLVATAERLIAERGFDAVSVRDITNAAGANSASIHYHFRSKEGLVQAILQERSTEMLERRRAHLEVLSDLAAPGPRDLALAMVMPTFEFVEGERSATGADRSFYVGFLAAVLDDPDLVHLVEENFEGQYKNYLMQLKRIRPDLPTHCAVNRVSFAMHLIINAVSEPARGLRVWIKDHHPAAVKRIETDLIDFIAGAFAAPVD